MVSLMRQKIEDIISGCQILNATSCYNYWKLFMIGRNMQKNDKIKCTKFYFKCIRKLYKLSKIEKNSRDLSW